MRAARLGGGTQFHRRYVPATLAVSAGWLWLSLAGAVRAQPADEPLDPGEPARAENERQEAPAPAEDETGAEAAPDVPDESQEEGELEAQADSQVDSQAGAQVDEQDTDPAAEPVRSLGPGAADPEAASEPPADAPDPNEEVIVVTARRREEDLQKAPVAVTVFSSRDLIERNVTAADDLSLFTPNLQLDGSAALSGGRSNATIFIRGIGQNDFAIFSDPGVGLYVDDVYLGRSMGGVLDVVDLQRVEVLRGPQGVLFGRNTIGGALVLTSRKPTFEHEGSVQLTAGSFFRNDFRTVLNAPIVDEVLAVRLVAARLSRDGYAERLVDDEELGDINRVAARAQLLWVPHQDVEVVLSADGTRAREHSAPSTLVQVAEGGFPFQNIFNQLVAPNAGVTAPSDQLDASFITGDPFTTYATGPNVNDLDVWGLSLAPTWDISPSVELKSITAFRSLEALFGRDGDNTPFTFREVLHDNEQTQVSQELRVAGSALDDRLEWLVGGYFFQEEATEDGSIWLAEGIYDALEALPAAMEFPPGGPPMPVFGGAGNPANIGADLVLDLNNEVTNRSFAGFTHATFYLLESLGLSAGLRVTHDTKDFSLVHQRLGSGEYIVAPGNEFSDSWTSLDPRAGVELQAIDEVMLYFTFATGFKSGGFNGRPLTNVEEVTKYEPERLTSFELGAKTTWLDRALLVNVAGFYYDYRDIQLTVNETPQNFVVNAARARSFGAEVETHLRAADALRLVGTLGYLNAEYTEIGEGLGEGQVAPITLDDELPKAPAVTASLGVEVPLSLGAGAGTLVPRTDLSYRSKIYHDVSNAEVLAQDGFALLGARVSWLSEDALWELAVFGTNLTDELYRVSGNAASPAFGIAESTFGRPREIGVMLEREF